MTGHAVEADARGTGGGVCLVAPGLQRNASEWHVLQPCRAELLNILSYFAVLLRLLICGL